MADETIGTTVAADVDKAEDTATVVLDHAADLTDALSVEIAKGKDGLATLRTHSAAGALGSTVQMAIDHFTGVFHSLEAALGLYKLKTATPPEPVVPVAPVAAEPASPVSETTAVEEPAAPAADPVTETVEPTAEPAAETVEPASEPATTTETQS